MANIITHAKKHPLHHIPMTPQRERAHAEAEEFKSEIITKVQWQKGRRTKPIRIARPTKRCRIVQGKPCWEDL